MDPLEKKRLANERRLKAIQEQKQRNQQNRNTKPTKIVYDTTTKNEKKNNLKLFDSDEEEDKNSGEMFRIRPQFQGKDGLKVLEMSSSSSGRFKMGEQFADDSESSEEEGDEPSEKAKNIKILESILGFEVSEKYPEGKSPSNKRQIERFDPDDKESSKYIKVDDVSEAQKTKRRKKKEVTETEAEEIPISTERYIEVTPNLKDLFTSSNSFSLTSKFQSNVEQNDNQVLDDLDNLSKSDSIYKKGKFPNKTFLEKKTGPVSEIKTNYTFFITGNDIRLKEGVDFFMRPKPLDEIREEWHKTNEGVMETFRQKKRSYARGFVNKHHTTQGKRTFIKK